MAPSVAMLTSIGHEPRKARARLVPLIGSRRVRWPGLASDRHVCGRRPSAGLGAVDLPIPIASGRSA